MGALILQASVLLAAASPATLAPWQPLIAEASTRFALPAPWIERVMMAESGGRAFVDGRPIRSPKGAIGLMQLMPQTWVDMRDAYHLGTDPDNPRDNILAGTAYLRAMYDRFGYPGMFAAYNAGPARYAASLATGQALPSETLAYLANVTGTSARFPTARRSAILQRLFVVRQDGSGHPDPLASSPEERLFAVRGSDAPSP